MNNELVSCPYCPRANCTPKELENFEGMCEFCHDALEQMRKWSLETLDKMVEKVKGEKNDRIS